MRAESHEVAALLVQRSCALGNFVPTLFILQSSHGRDGLDNLLTALYERLDMPKGPFLVHKA